MILGKRQRPEKSVSQCKAGTGKDGLCNEIRAEETARPFSSVTMIVNTDSGDGAGACAAAGTWATRVSPTMIKDRIGKLRIRSKVYRKAKPTSLDWRSHAVTDVTALRYMDA